MAVLVGVGFGGYRYFTREVAEQVTVVEARLGTVEQTVSATGVVASAATVLVTAELGVPVVGVYFDEQDRVKKGQVLAKLDDTDLGLQLRQQRANINLLQAKLAKAELHLQRLQRLLPKGFVAPQEVDAAQEQVETYRAKIEDGRLSANMIEARRHRSVVTAPIAGIVTRKFVLVGGIPRESSKVSGAAPPGAIAEIAELSSSEFHADVDQTDIVKIRVPQKATIRLDALPGEVFAGVTREIAGAPQVDPTSRVRYQVRLAVEKAGRRLKPGMSGSVSFDLSRKTQVVTLPPPVILQEGEQESVFVLDENRARLRKIKTGLQGEDVVEVVSGLRPGEQVIDRGRGKLKDGQLVTVVSAAPR